MAFFSPDFYNFFIELAANNNKDWFDINRKRYNASVKTPFDNFIKAVIEEINSIDKSIEISHSDAIFRINRDIRFAKDKTPYKLDRSAIISRYGRKDKSFPGIYLNLNPEKFSIFSGVYRLKPDQILRIREEIMDHPKKFQSLISEPNFVQTFGSILGEKSKRINKELAEAAKKEPLIWNKSWHVISHFPKEAIFQDNLVQLVAAHYKVAKPFCDFLTRPVEG